MESKVKVIKPFLGLEVGTELVWNELSETYDFYSDDEDITEGSRARYVTDISLPPYVISEHMGEYFDLLTTPALYNEEDFVYVKPIVLKAWTNISSNCDTCADEVVVENCLTKERVFIKKSIFNKLFKVITNVQ